MITLHGKCRLFPETKFLGRSRLVRLRANGRNIVDQQLPTLLDVQTDATLLADNSRRSWEFLRPFALSLKLEVNLNFNLA